MATHHQLIDDSASAPAVLQRNVSQVTVGVISEVQNLATVPPSHLLQLCYGTLCQYRRTLYICAN